MTDAVKMEWKDCAEGPVSERQSIKSFMKINYSTPHSVDTLVITDLCHFYKLTTEQSGLNPIYYCVISTQDLRRMQTDATEAAASDDYMRSIKMFTYFITT